MAQANELDWKNSIVSVEWNVSSPFPLPRTTRRTPRRYAEGLRYERKALARLRKEFSNFVGHPWLRYRLAGEKFFRYAQPDGLIFNFAKGRIIICECKVSHVASAYAQMFHLYQPLLARLFPAPAWHFTTIEFTRTFDCAVFSSKPPVVVRSVYDVQPGQFGVVIWKV